MTKSQSGARPSENESVSNHHARIDWRHDHAEIVDVGSSNGTFVNGKKVSARLRLQDNDSIDFGGVQVFFFAVATLRRRMKATER